MKLITRTLLIFAACFVVLLVMAIHFTNFQHEHTQKKSVLIVKPKSRKGWKSPSTSKRPQNLVNVALLAQRLIDRKLKSLNFTAYRNERHRKLVDSLVADSTLRDNLSGNPWALAARWVHPRQVLPNSAPELGAVMSAMCNTPFMKADVGLRGSQLKLHLLLEGGQYVVFKPQKYERHQVIEGLPYAGADRHNGEIAAFHLSRLLALRRTPIAVGRKLALHKDVLPVATQVLAETFFKRGNKTCFYGRCHYCSPKYAACTEDGEMEGALILWLPRRYILKLHRSPWQRTYKKGTLAAWELDPEYCSIVRESAIYKNGSRLLDLVDTAIFDYLIGNADRHHYETFAEHPGSMVLLLDNGKSFGNPHLDEVTILAPLYQCCIIRDSTFMRLKLFVNNLGTSLNRLLSTDPLFPILTQQHLEALDRRLMTVIAAVHVCLDKHGQSAVVSS